MCVRERDARLISEARTWTTALPYLGGCLGEEGSASIQHLSTKLSQRRRSYRINTDAGELAAATRSAGSKRNPTGAWNRVGAPRNLKTALEVNEGW